MRIVNAVLGYDAETEFAGSPHYERFKIAGALCLGSLAVTGAGVVLSSLGVSAGHIVAEAGGYSALGTGIATVIEARLPWQSNSKG